MAVLSRPGFELQPHQIVLRPLVTEKGTHLSERHNSFAFEVHQHATKTDIRTAVESLFKVRVVSVRTQTRVGKARRSRNVYVQGPSWKKAIVKLHEDDRISFF
ncbi:MAG: 50S ribosomal protein L23 [Planctomycetota bacterium]|nr:50S ribosomal protein L23 [Planctomycetota bacterium]